MVEREWLAGRFEEQRPRLKGIAYRMLGSLAEADEAVQNTWLRVSRADASDVENIGGWLTTIVARVCLNALQTRKARSEQMIGLRMPDPLVSREGSTDPEREALLADSFGTALLILLDTLAPAERLAFVLHDMFDLSFEEIASIVGKSPAASRQLASRARRRVRDAVPPRNADLGRQRQIIEAFGAAVRAGDIDAILTLLDPNVVRRSDVPTVGSEERGAARVARMALLGGQTRSSASAIPVLVNGDAGVLVIDRGRIVGVLGFTFSGDKIIAIDVVADPDRLRGLGLDLASLRS